MKNALRTLLIIFAIPLLGLAVSIGIEIYQTGQLHQALSENFPEVPKEKIRAISLHAFLEGLDEAEMKEFRTDMKLLGALKYFAIGYILVLGGILISIRILGARCAKNRERLLVVFKPLYYLVSTLLVVSTPINAALAVGAIYYGEVYLISRIHIWVILLAGLAGIVGSYLVIKNALLGAKGKLPRIKGKIAAPDSKIAAFVNETASAMEARKVDNVILGPDPSFFASEAPMEVGVADAVGTSLYLSTTLCDYLSPEELRAIIGHELAHYQGLDTKYSLQFYPIYRGLHSSLEELAAKSGMGLGASIALLPTIYVFGFFLDSFSKAEAALSREREALADSAGAGITSPEVFGRALLKISLIAQGIRRLGEAGEEDIQGRFPREKFLADFEGNKGAYLEEILSTVQAHPYDSHPLLKERLDKVGVTVELLADDIDFSAAGTATEILLDTKGESC